MFYIIDKYFYEGKIYMNTKIICLAIALCTLITLLCSCTSSSGDSLLEVVAGVAGTSSEDVSSELPSSSSQEESSLPESSENQSSEVSSESDDEEEDNGDFDITYPEKNYNTAKKAYVNTQTDPLTMRTNPSSSNYTTIMMIPKGAEISVKGETGSFYFVEYKEKLGWVSAAYVKFADDTSSTTSSEGSSET